MELVESFSTEYPPINRLLPVWRVNFDRPDGLHAFVDTTTSKLGALQDNKRLIFLQFFRWFHNFSFLSEGETWHILLISLLCFLSFSGAVTGLILYSGLYSRLRKPKSKQQKFSQQHRVIGTVFSIGLLMFSFSGIWHAISKFEPDHRHHYFDRSIIPVSALSTPFNEIIRQAELRGVVQKVSLVQWMDVPNIRIVLRNAQKTEVVYVRMDNGAFITEGDASYARHLAGIFSNLPHGAIHSLEKITRFNDEYGFINKRLPVFFVEYDLPDHPRYYVETGSGHLAAKVTDGSAMERFSFSNLHKWGVLDATGKDARDATMALFSFGNIVIALLGGYIFLKRRRSKKQMEYMSAACKDGSLS